MKGLKQYLRKHGAHFTEELARDVIPIKWDMGIIDRAIKDEVWFNCWSATKGDMLFLVNVAYFETIASKKLCIDYMLGIVGDYNNKDVWFLSWLKENAMEDITPYI